MPVTQEVVRTVRARRGYRLCNWERGESAAGRRDRTARPCDGAERIRDEWDYLRAALRCNRRATLTEAVRLLPHDILRTGSYHTVQPGIIFGVISQTYS